MKKEYQREKALLNEIRIMIKNFVNKIFISEI
jgi:hypothetical protein